MMYDLAQDVFLMYMMGIYLSCKMARLIVCCNFSCYAVDESNYVIRDVTFFFCIRCYGRTSLRKRKMQNKANLRAQHITSLSLCEGKFT
jgi:hypothetical protein